MLVQMPMSIAKFSTYAGEFVQMNLHEGIIDADLWLEVQYELDKNKPISNSGRGTHTWLTGLTKCGYCGLSVTVVNGQKNGKRYINCGGRKNKICYERKKSITFDSIEDNVKYDLINHIKNFEFTKIERNLQSQKEKNKIKIQLKKVQDEIESLINKIPMANEKVMKYINEKVELLEQQRCVLQNQLNVIKNNNFESISDNMIRATLTNWDNLSFEDKKLIASTFIEKVIIYDDRLDIVYK